MFFFLTQLSRRSQEELPKRWELQDLQKNCNHESDQESQDGVVFSPMLGTPNLHEKHPLVTAGIQLLLMLRAFTKSSDDLDRLELRTFIPISHTHTQTHEVSLLTLSLFTRPAQGSGTPITWAKSWNIGLDALKPCKQCILEITMEYYGYE